MIMAMELRGRDITVDSVAPGPTATPLFLDGKPQEVIHLAKMSPLDRLGQRVCGTVRGRRAGACSASSRGQPSQAVSSQALALRSRIVLQCAAGHSNQDVATVCGVLTPTVGKWRRRFCELRLDGLSDDPRPGRPAKITAEQVEDVVVQTLESVPENATHWSRSKWLSAQACRSRRSGGSGGRLSSSLTGRTRLSSPPTRCLSRRSLCETPAMSTKRV
jgi:hypothetical protein